MGPPPTQQQKTYGIYSTKYRNKKRKRLLSLSKWWVFTITWCHFSNSNPSFRVETLLLRSVLGIFPRIRIHRSSQLWSGRPLETNGGEIWSSWWFQPIWKICSSNWIISIHFPKDRGENKKDLKPPSDTDLFRKERTLPADWTECKEPFCILSVFFQTVYQFWWVEIDAELIFSHLSLVAGSHSRGFSYDTYSRVNHLCYLLLEHSISIKNHYWALHTAIISQSMEKTNHKPCWRLITQHPIKS